MRLANETTTTRRIVFTACAGATDSPMTPAQKQDLLRRLIDRCWAPTPEDTPAPFGAVEAWYAEVQKRIPSYGHDGQQTRDSLAGRTR